MIGKVSSKSSRGHEYILVPIDYFTKWVEAASYTRLTAAKVAKFIRSHIICRYGVLHELISYREYILEVRWIHWFRSMEFDIIDHLRTCCKLMGQLRLQIKI